MTGTFPLILSIKHHLYHQHSPAVQSGRPQQLLNSLEQDQESQFLLEESVLMNGVKLVPELTSLFLKFLSIH